MLFFDTTPMRLGHSTPIHNLPYEYFQNFLSRKILADVVETSFWAEFSMLGKLAAKPTYLLLEYLLFSEPKKTTDATWKCQLETAWARGSYAGT